MNADSPTVWLDQYQLDSNIQILPSYRFGFFEEKYHLSD